MIDKKCVEKEGREKSGEDDKEFFKNLKKNQHMRML
jgi:hypothetical protein